MAITEIITPDEMGLAKGQLAWKLHSDSVTASHLFIELHVEKNFNSGVFDFVIQMEHALDPNGDVEFKVDEFIRSLLQFQLPDVNEDEIQDVNGTCLRYQLKYAEKSPGDLQYIQSAYHNDKTGAAPYLISQKLDEPLEVGFKYLTISETSDPDQITNLEYKLNTIVLDPGTIDPHGSEMHQNMAANTTMAYDTLRFPAGVNVRIYKNTLTYTNSGIYYALLGGFSKKFFGVTVGKFNDDFSDDFYN